MKRTAIILWIVLFGSLLVFGQEGADKLAEARAALKGAEKNPAKARQILLEIVEKDKDTLDPVSLCYVYVYLGYTEDRAGNREEAIPWYKKALEIQGAGGIQACAKFGLEQPLTWIRHLDEGAAAPPEVSGKKEPIGKGYVTTDQPPANLTPAKSLSTEERLENFEILCKAIDRNYAHFDLKSINWPEVCARYRKRLDTLTTTEDFYFLLFQLVNELKDLHSWLQNYKRFFLTNGPGLAVDMFDDKPFVTAVNPDSDAARAGVKPGWMILGVDDVTVPQRVEQLRSCLHACSSERAFKRQAYRFLLAGERDTTVAIKLLRPGGTPATISLKRNAGVYAKPRKKSYPFDVTKQRYVHYGHHPAGFGYIHMESFAGREEIADEFDKGLEDLRATPALILDIRDNEGGFGNAQPRIVGRFITQRTLVAMDYRKNGPAHSDLRRHEFFFSPSGEWQYTRPVALLVNDVTGSAADLFACYVRSTGRVVTLGSTTHGNLSGVAAYVVLPCNLVVRISNGYVCDAKGKPIECNGNEPDVAVTPSAADFLKGHDPVLDKAVAVLRGMIK